MAFSDRMAAPWLRQREATLFAVLTFAWAWSLWGYWVVAMPSGGLQISAAFLVCAMVGGLAPSLSALILTLYARGTQGVLTALQALLKWPPDGVSLALALMLAPSMAVLGAIVQGWLIGPLVWPAPALLLAALVWPLMAALGEELGWRGYLLPRLLDRFNLLTSAVLLGVLWGFWHLPADYIALKGYGGWFWAAFLLNGPLILTGHSIIMAWLWRRSSGSLPIAVLYHFTITASAMLAPSAGTQGVTGLLSAAISAAVVWLAALALLIFRHQDFA